MTSNEVLVQICNRKLSLVEKTRANFISKLDSDPMYALSWGDAFLKATVEKELYSGLKTTLENAKFTTEELAKQYTMNLIRLSNNGTSSSDMANLMKKVEATVTGEIVNAIMDVMND